MLTKDQAFDIFQRAKKYASVDEVEVLISGGRSALTRFANNTITQNVADENYEVSVRVAFDHKTARATTNRLDDEGLKSVVQAAESLTRLQEPDPDLLPMPTAQEAGRGTEPDRYFEETAGVGPSQRAEVAGKMVGVARRQSLIAAGVAASSEHVDAIFNSKGVAAYHRQTGAEVSITMLATDSSGWQKANSPNVADVHPVRLAEIAAEKARKSAGPKELEPGKYTVVLEPAAVLDLCGFLMWDFSGLALLEQRSCLNNRMRTRLFGENISIFDDVHHPLQAGPGFDGEGMKRERVELVKNGVVQNVVFARATSAMAKKSPGEGLGVEIRPTGHGFPLPNEIGEIPQNVVFGAPTAGKERTVEQMVAATEKGILVTRLWYIREVEPYEKLLTGMTRDGTFWIEEGKVRFGVRNFRFNQSVVQMLQNVLEMSTPVRASGEESFDMVVPAMKVRDFNFTEVTRF
ncbi:MAG: TldD/PmbA family protein [Terriglobia bacterium]|nr:TldD/PmbA family protein [Terriglobia bacterium]